jgi:hypothetical protein
VKATMESTSKLVIVNGLNFRVWEGITEKGVAFVALVNRLESTDPQSQQLLITETSEKHKDPEGATGFALARLGV